MDKKDTKAERMNAAVAIHEETVSTVSTKYGEKIGKWAADMLPVLTAMVQLHSLLPAAADQFATNAINMVFHKYGTALTVVHGIPDDGADTTTIEEVVFPFLNQVAVRIIEATNGQQHKESV